MIQALYLIVINMVSTAGMVYGCVVAEIPYLHKSFHFMHDNEFHNNSDKIYLFIWNSYHYINWMSINDNVLNYLCNSYSKNIQLIINFVIHKCQYNLGKQTQYNRAINLNITKFDRIKIHCYLTSRLMYQGCQAQETHFSYKLLKFHIFSIFS